MKQVTSLVLANEVIAKLVSMIEYEYEFAKFAHYEYAPRRVNFNNENEQLEYLLWSGGQLEVMTRIKDKIDEIFDGVFIDIINELIK